MGGRTLKEHCEGSKIVENYTFNYSKHALADLGFISEVNSVWVPNDDENVRNRNIVNSLQIFYNLLLYTMIIYFYISVLLFYYFS